MKKIAPSLLSADFARLGEEVRAVEAAGADWIHLDVMDGHFVPNLTIGPAVVEAVRRITSLPLDVHLMVRHPDEFLPAFAEAGSDLLTVHVETCPHLHRTLTEIRRRGKRAGVALNPATPLSALESVLEFADLVLVMTVNPGFGGQEFIPAMGTKIERLREKIDREGRTLELEVDGGIKVENISAVARAGADVFVCGSGVFQTKDYAATMAAMRKEIEKYIHRRERRR